MKLIFTLFFCFVASLFAKTIAQINMQDSLALVALYDSAGGPNWYNHENWLTQAPVSTWGGVYVSDNRVYECEEVWLKGTLPHQLGNLTSLLILELSGTITGTIPAEIGYLDKLWWLAINGQHITGKIPQSFTHLINLETLELANNELSGSIPSFLGNLPQLRSILLNKNNFSGSIPSSLGNLLDLVNLNLSYNKLTGKIPASLGKIPYLGDLIINNNQITGSIPKEFNQFFTIDDIDFSNNFLTGTIPSFLGNFNNLWQIKLENNLLSGNIPAEIGNDTSLTFFIVDHNKLTGNIPEALSKPKFLNTLQLNNNNLSGKIPASFNKNKNLYYLQLDHNDLTDVVPLLDSLKKLQQLTLNNNNLTFAGMEDIATHFSFAQYAPQASIKLKNNNNVLSVSAGGALSNNAYHWYKDGTLYKTNVGDSTLTINETGNYYVIVNNSIAQKLTLYSDTIDVTILPVNLLSFTAQKQISTTLLQWQTADEINNDYFSIERSPDSKLFTSIGSKPALNGSTKNSYSFKDNAPINDINYYRLKQVDKDGKFTYSNIVSVDFNNNASAFSVYPNPANSSLNITLPSSNSVSEIVLYDINGKKILQEQTAANIASKQIDISKLASGVYNVTLIQNGKQQTLRMVKK